MHPHASWLRRPNGMHLAYPDIGFALFPLAPLIPLFSLGSGNTHKGFLGHTPKDFSCLRAHGKHRLHEKPTSSFVADLSHATDLMTMGQIDVGPYLAPRAPRERNSLVPWSVAGEAASRPQRTHLVHRANDTSALVSFQVLHVSGQRTQRILCHASGRLYRSSRATHIVQLDTPKGSLGPALGIQHVLCIHPVFYHFVKCGEESGF